MKSSRKLPRCLCALLLVFTLLTSISVLQISVSADNEAVKAARNGVVQVYQKFYADGEPLVYQADDGNYYEWGYTGSGFCVGEKGKSPQYVVTNRHCVDYWDTNLLERLSSVVPYVDRQNIHDFYQQRITIKLYILVDNREYEIGEYGPNYNNNILLPDNANLDLAIVHVNSAISNRVPLTIGVSSELDATDEVFAIGFPGTSMVEDEGTFSPTIAHMSVTDGIVAKAHVTVNGIDNIQMTAVIQGGNSGGPLVNEDGYVVGVNTWGKVRYDRLETSNFAIESKYVESLLNQYGVPFMKAQGNSKGSAPADNSNSANNSSTSSIYDGLVFFFALLMLGGIIAFFVIRNRRKPVPVPDPWTTRDPDPDPWPEPEPKPDPNIWVEPDLHATINTNPRYDPPPHVDPISSDGLWEEPVLSATMSSSSSSSGSTSGGYSGYSSSPAADGIWTEPDLGGSMWSGSSTDAADTTKKDTPVDPDVDVTFTSSL